LDSVGSGTFFFGSLWLVFVELHKFVQIELWLLEDLGLSNHAVILEWEDFAALVLDLFANFFFKENFDELLESRLLNSCLHNLHHLFNDQLLVGVFSITCGLHLLLGSLSESDCEQSEDESIGSLGLNACLNEGVPFLDHGACLISGNIHSVEVCEAIESLNLIDLEFKLSPGLGLGLEVAVSERDVENTTFQTV